MGDAGADGPSGPRQLAYDSQWNNHWVMAWTFSCRRVLLSSLLRVTKKVSEDAAGHRAMPSRCSTFLPAARTQDHSRQVSRRLPRRSPNGRPLRRPVQQCQNGRRRQQPYARRPPGLQQPVLAVGSGFDVRGPGRYRLPLVGVLSHPLELTGQPRRF